MSFFNNWKLKQTLFACKRGCFSDSEASKTGCFYLLFSNNADMLILSSSPGPRCASWPAVERTLPMASWPLKPGRSSQIITLLYRRTSDDTYKTFQHRKPQITENVVLTENDSLNFKALKNEGAY